jgi:hypothetical protein
MIPQKDDSVNETGGISAFSEFTSQPPGRNPLQMRYSKYRLLNNVYQVEDGEVERNHDQADYAADYDDH